MHFAELQRYRCGHRALNVGLTADWQRVAFVQVQRLVYVHHVSEAESEPVEGRQLAKDEPSRTVICADAMPWLLERVPVVGASFITSLPDVSAFSHMTLDAWKAWFRDAARRVIDATCPTGVTIFYQTDIKRDGAWVDKGYLCQRAAEEVGVELLWHKVVCRKPAGEPVFGRPGYSHMLCFAKRVRDKAAAYPDVLRSTGEMTWSQATGVAACELACRYVLSHTATRTVVDPFCGVGTVLAVANSLGLDALGVEIANKRARKARSLAFPPQSRL